MRSFLIMLLLATPMAVCAAGVTTGGVIVQPSDVDQQVVKDCQAKGGEYGRFGGSRVDYCRMPDEAARQAKCVADGGTWGPQGKAGIPQCTKHFADADKACKTNADCMSKACLVDKATEASGKCKGDDSHFGCFEYFEKNKDGHRTGMCVD